MHFHTFRIPSPALQHLGSSLRLRLSFLVTGVLLTVVFASALTVLVFVREIEARKWQGRQTDAVQSAAGTVTAFLQRVEDTTRWISLLSRTDLEEKPKLLGDVLRQNPSLLELVRTDAAAHVFVSADQGSSLLTGDTNAGNVQRLASRVSGDKQIYVGAESLGNPERFLVYVLRVPTGGVIIARLRMNVLWEIVSQIQFGETGGVFVATREGMLIAHTDTTRANSALPLSSRALLTGKTVILQYTNPQGLAVVAAATPVTGTDWIVVAEMQSTEAYAETNKALVSLPIGALLIGLAVVVTMQQLLQHSIFNPLERLREGAERIGQGDLAYRISVGWRDEIGRVAASFNTMAERLSQRNAELLTQTQLLAAQIAEREKVQGALRTSEARYRAVVQDQTDMICRFQKDLTLTFGNDALRRYFDLPAEEWNGRSFLEFIPIQWRESALAHLAGLDSTHPLGTLQYEQELRGAMRWQAWTIRALCAETDGVREYQAVGRDITDQKRVEEQLVHDALHDALTGLPNRVLLLDRLNRTIEHAHRNPRYGFAVLFLDMDRFKIINDTLGHLMGDQVLVAAARRLVASVRPEDTVARLGGDEFAILLEGIRERRQVAYVVERLQIALSEPFSLEGHELFTNVSIGIALGSDTAGSVYQCAEDVLRDADTAMYRAKASGSGQHTFFDPVMHSQVSDIFHLEAELRRALERNEFILVYQPVFDAQTSVITQVEALVRWRHPQRGLVAPAEFIPLAEETGLIRPLGEWILQTACTQANTWLGQGCAPRCISINVSPAQFDSPGFVDVVRRVLEDTHLPSAMLELEITEGAAMRDMDLVEGRMRELEKLGVRIAIDDFGTGYSSLARLKRFPLRTLKIDRLFIKDLLTDPDDAAITTAIIAMAHNLKLEVIAEGVETWEQADFLKKNGCDHMQGFFFSEPKMAQDLALASPHAVLPTRTLD